MFRRNFFKSLFAFAGLLGWKAATQSSGVKVEKEVMYEIDDGLKRNIPDPENRWKQYFKLTTITLTSKDPIDVYAWLDDHPQSVDEGFEFRNRAISVNTDATKVKCVITDGLIGTWTKRMG